MFNGTLKKSSCAVAFALLSMSSLSMSQENPFEFKEAVPVVTEQPVQQVVKQDPNLTSEQRLQVADMIKQTLASMELKDEGARTVEIDKKEYVILDEGERLTGITSGMFAVYSNTTLDYEFYDTQKYLKVISMSEYEKLKSNAQKRVGVIIESIKDGVSGLSSLSDNQSTKDTIPPGLSALGSEQTTTASGQDAPPLEID